MEVQAALGSDVALAFDECTPFHVPRDYTARSTERTHRWLDRAIVAHNNVDGNDKGHALFGIVQGGMESDFRVESAQYVATADVAARGTPPEMKPPAVGREAPRAAGPARRD